MRNGRANRNEIKAAGKNSHEGGNNHRGSSSRNGARGAATDKAAQRKGGQHSHSGHSGNR